MRFSRAAAGGVSRTRETVSANDSRSVCVGHRKSAIQDRPSPARTSSPVTGSAANSPRYPGR